MRFNQLVFTTTVLLGLALISESGGFALKADKKEDVPKLFNRAIAAEGAAYLQVRDAIVARGTEAVPFLKQERSGKDRTRRILAAAILGWISEPQKSTRREELVHAALIRSQSYALDRPSSLQLEAARVPRALAVGPTGIVEGPATKDRIHDELHEGSAVPFLLELVLKGAIHRPRPEDAGKYAIDQLRPSEREVRSAADNPQYCLWTRWYAAALVGRLEGADVIPALTDLLQSSKDAGLRSSAAAGLGKTRSPYAVEPLIAALGDKDRGVRDKAGFALKKITKQEFGTDQEKWRAWWKENRERLLKTRR